MIRKIGSSVMWLLLLVIAFVLTFTISQSQKNTHNQTSAVGTNLQNQTTPFVAFARVVRNL